MPQPNPQNPYQPPEADDLHAEPEATAAMTDDVWAIPGLTWKNAKRLTRRALETNVLWLVGLFQALYVAAIFAPQGLSGMQPAGPFSQQEPPDPGNIPEEFLPLVVAGMAVGVISMMLAGTLLRPMRRLLLDGTHAVGGAGEAFSMGIRRLPHMLGVGILTYLAAIVGMCACIVPGLVISIALWFPIYVVLATDLGVIESMKGGWEFFKRQWKPYLVGAAAFVVVYMAVTCPLTFLSMVPIVGPYLWAVAFAGIFLGLYVGYTALLCTLEQRDRHQYGAAAWEQPNYVPREMPGDPGRGPGGAGREPPVDGEPPSGVGEGGDGSIEDDGSIGDDDDDGPVHEW